MDETTIPTSQDATTTTPAATADPQDQTATDTAPQDAEPATPSHTDTSPVTGEIVKSFTSDTKRSYRLHDADIALAIRLAADGMHQDAIAKRLGVTQSAISLLLAKYRPTVDAARALIHAKAGKVAKQWLRAVPVAARKGDHRPAKDWLAAAGVVAATPENNQQVLIQIGDGQAGAPVPSVFVAKVPANEE